MGLVVSATSRLLYTRERPGTHCTGGWMGPRAGWTGAENLAPTRFQSPDRPALIESLYPQSYPGKTEVSTQHYTPAALTPGMTHYPWNIILVGPRAGLRVLEKKLLPLPEFDTRTVQLWCTKMMKFDWGKEWQRTKKVWTNGNADVVIYCVLFAARRWITWLCRGVRNNGWNQQLQMFVVCSKDRSDEQAAPNGRRED